MKEGTTKEAVLHILKEMQLSKYRLAQMINVKPIMVNNYIRDNKPCKMGVTTAQNFEALFQIKITDVYSKS